METNWEETRNKYRMAAVHFANRYGVEVSEHVIDVMISAMMTKDSVLHGGSFVQAVINNDLRDAISRADKDCLTHLRIITLCANFCNVQYEMNE